MKLSALLFAVLVACSTFLPDGAIGGSATWNLDPTSGDWNTAANWTPVTVPNGPADIATFASSSQTEISLSADTEIAGIIFDSNASSYNLTCQPDVSLTVLGGGVTNNSAIDQNIFVSTADAGGRGTIAFKQGASAGDRVLYTVDGAKRSGPAGLAGFFRDATAGSATFVTNPGYVVDGQGGVIQFYDESTAADSTIVNSTGPNSSLGGHTEFYNNATAGNATITNEARTISGSTNGQTIFYNTATAGAATFINKGSSVGGFNNSGFTFFFANSTAGNSIFFLEPAAAPGGEPGRVYFDSGTIAGNATIVAESGPAGYQGGIIDFEGTSRGDNARIILDNPTALLWIDVYEPMSLGSIEGSGNIIMPNALTVGGNNLDTVFTGSIGNYGSLIKVGNGRLVLGGPSTYEGYGSVAGTIVRRGTLLVNNKRGSGTGTGSVLVTGGTLGGSGFIAGPVEVGGVISPGRNAKTAGSLTIRNTLMLDDTGSYKFAVDTNSVKADQIVAKGVTIAAGAQFLPFGVGTGSIAPGTVFTAIDNTAQTPITGSFANLPDEGTITIGNNSFQANYEGGDGNDLTLTVVQ